MTYTIWANVRELTQIFSQHISLWVFILIFCECTPAPADCVAAAAGCGYITVMTSQCRAD